MLITKKPLRRKTRLQQGGKIKTKQKSGVKHGKVSKKVRIYGAAYRALCKSIYERAGGQCEIAGKGCEGRASSIHHKHHRSLGGSDTKDNLVAACGWCHREAHGTNRVNRPLLP